MDFAIRITNLAEFQKALKTTHKVLVAEFKSELRAIGAPIAAEIRGKVPRGPSGKARRSVKVSATMKGAAIKAGGDAAPYFHWLDFGGSTGRGHIPKVAGSGSIKRQWLGTPVGMGRYVYPTISEHTDEIKKAAGDALGKAGRKGGFEVR